MEEEADNQRRNKKNVGQGLSLILVYSIFSAVLGMFQFGYNIGVMNSHEVKIERFIRSVYREKHEGLNMSYGLSVFMYTILVSIFSIGGMCGSFCGGWIARRFGRKGGLLITNIVSIVGACCMFFSKPLSSYDLLIVGRYFIGFNCGLNTYLVPLYLSEISPLNLGRYLGTVNQLVLALGLLFSEVLGIENFLGIHIGIGWSYSLGIAVFPSILQIFLLPLSMESPRYLLITKNKKDSVCEELRHVRNQPNIEEDLAEMHSENDMTIFELLRSPSLRRPLLICLMMQLSQQLSGIIPILNYSTNLFISSGLSETTSQQATAALGAVMVFMTLISIPYMNRYGRRSLYLWGLGGMFVCSLLMTISLFLKELLFSVRWLFVVFMLLYVAFFSVGVCSVPWMMSADLFSQGSRPAAMSVTLFINWCASFLVSICFPTMQNMLEVYTFLPFSVILVMVWIFTYRKVPETKR